MNLPVQLREGMPEHVAVTGILSGFELVQRVLPRQL